ncbi:MAG: hypothetical protein HQM08_19255 [Candidatus Riflebacteria bacterium]|nr:hypothetical protein [Candidatus Riflebacteria bacterium]
MPGIDFINAAYLIDDDLKLAFIEKTYTSPPDLSVPVYKFRMESSFSGEEIGGINLRAGYTENIILFRGNIGFTVLEKFRGKHFSARSCILLKPIIKNLDLPTIWLTCNLDNNASRKNLEYIGATYVETIKIPENSPYLEFYPPEARIKMRFKWQIS